MNNYFPTPLQEFVFYDKYSRFRDDLGRRETWPEAVDRAVEFLKELSKNKLSQDVYDRIHSAILNLEVMPSLRLMAMAGEAARRNNIAIFNCGYLNIDSVDSFVEIMVLSMNGCGLGYSVEKQNISKLPTVPMKLEQSPYVHIVPDTTEGWYESLRKHLNSLYNGNIISFDYSQVRPAGSRLKVKGGQASGPEVLKEALDAITQIFLNARGRHLSSLECSDIACWIGNAAVSGGMRRTAMLSLSDHDDELMRTAKIGSFPRVRYNVNNSMVLDFGITKEIFFKEMDTLFDGGTGERGIFNRQAAVMNSPTRRIWFSKPGINACQPGFATVLTPLGIRTFDEVGIGSIIWSGEQWTTITNKQMTGIKPVSVYSTSFGSFVGTGNHRILQNGERARVENADGIDVAIGPEYIVQWNPQDVMDGLVVGDGSVHTASDNLVYLCIGQKDGDYASSEIGHLIIKERPGLSPTAWEIKTTIAPNELPRTFDRLIPERFYKGTLDTAAGFLRGLFSANGYSLGHRIGLKQTSYRLILQVQEMLSSLGIRSYITVNKAKIVHHHNGDYESKQSYDLNISTDRFKFMDLIGFLQNYKNNIKGNVGKGLTTAEIRNVQPIGEFPVYDITVEAEEHTYWTGGLLVSNCAEIILQTAPNGGGLCNLSSVICRENDTKESLLKKIETATIIGTIQATAEHFPGLRQGWVDVQRRERLLGVDLNGQMDCPILVNDKGKLREALTNRAVEVNMVYAEKLGIRPAAAVTCVKPNGNSSQLLDCASGLHPRYAPYYIRRVQISDKSPIFQVLKESGVKLKPYQGDKWVAEFSIKSPENSKFRKDFSAVEMCEFWLLNKTWYTEHNPSVTIYYKEEEREALKEWLWAHYDKLGGLAFFPYSDAKYSLQPYEEITEEEYEALEKPVIDWSLLQKYELYDQTTASQEIGCASGACAWG